MTAELFLRPRRGERLEADMASSLGESAPAPGYAARERQDPYGWVRGLCGTQAGFALALSDMPRTKAAREQALGGFVEPRRPNPRVLGEPRRLTPAGMRVASAWVVQGVQRGGGPVALWETAANWRRQNMKNQEDKDLEKWLGGPRRLDSALDMASYVTTDYDPVYLRVCHGEHNRTLIRWVTVLYPPDWSNPRSAPTAIFKLRRHDAHMVAASHGRTLTPHPSGGYWLD